MIDFCIYSATQAKQPLSHNVNNEKQQVSVLHHLATTIAMWGREVTYCPTLAVVITTRNHMEQEPNITAITQFQKST